jgi:hypothetical protein
LRTKKEALRKIEEWKNNPMLVSGIYRLFTYLPWDTIPEEYKTFFPAEAKEKWDEDLSSYGKTEVELDIDAEVRAILKVLVKKNVTHCMGLIPMVLADVYMHGTGISVFQSSLIKIINNYKKYVDIDRQLAEQYSMIEIIDLLKTIINKVGIKLSFDIDIVAAKLNEEYEKNTAKFAKQFAKSKGQDHENSLDFDKMIAEAEAKEEEAKRNMQKDGKYIENEKRDL